MITDYEFDDFVKKLKAKNNNKTIAGPRFSFDASNYTIINSNTTNIYAGPRNSLDIFQRLFHKYNQKNNAFETHLQAYIAQRFDKQRKLSNLLIPYPNLDCWIGNEVSCGVGMQRIDLMLKQETDSEVVIRLIELKDEAPYLEIITNQIPWYLEWLSYYVVPKYQNKKVRIIPTIIARGNMPAQVQTAYKNFKLSIVGATVEPLQYIGFSVNSRNVDFVRYL